MRISVHEDPRKRMHMQISKDGDPRMRMQMRISVCGGSCYITTANPGDNPNWGSPVGGSSTNNYTDNEVLSQSLQLPVHTIGNENGSSRISAHIL